MTIAGTSEQLEKLRVGKILRATSRAFVPDQVIARDHPYLRITEPCRNAQVPGFGELYAGQFCQQIHAVWRPAQLNYAIVGLTSYPMCRAKRCARS